MGNNRESRIVIPGDKRSEITAGNETSVVYQLTHGKVGPMFSEGMEFKAFLSFFLDLTPIHDQPRIKCYSIGFQFLAISPEAFFRLALREGVPGF